MQVQTASVPPKLESPANTAAKESKNEKAAEIGEKTASPEKMTAPNGEAKTEQAESSYLKVVSRLQGMVDKGEVVDMAVESFTKAVKNRLEDLSDQDKKQLLALPEFKGMKLNTLDELPKKIQEDLKSKDQAKAMLSLLRNPKFAEAMNKENNNAKTYTPQSVNASPAASTVKPATPAAEVPAAKKEKEMALNAAKMQALQSTMAKNANPQPSSQVIAAA